MGPSKFQYRFTRLFFSQRALINPKSKLYWSLARVLHFSVSRLFASTTTPKSNPLVPHHDSPVTNPRSFLKPISHSHICQSPFISCQSLIQARWRQTPYHRPTTIQLRTQDIIISLPILIHLHFNHDWPSLATLLSSHSPIGPKPTSTTSIGIATASLNSDGGNIIFSGRR